VSFGRHLGWVGVLALGAAYLASGGGPGLTADEAPRPGARATLPADLQAVPRDALATVSVRLADLWRSEFGKQLRQQKPKEVAGIAKVMEQNLGVTVDQVERVTLVFDERQEQPSFFVTTSGPYERAKVIAALGRGASKESRQGRTYYVGKNNRAAYLIDDRTFLSGPSRQIQAYLARPAVPTGPLQDALVLAAGKHLAVVGVNPLPIIQQVGEPPELEPFKALLKTQGMTATLDLGEQARLKVRVRFPDAAAAQAGEKALRALWTLAQGAVGSGIQQMEARKEPASLIALARQAEQGLKTASLKQQGPVVEGTLQIKGDPGAAGVALLEAVQKVREAAARTQSVNNLKQLGLAMHNYHDVNRGFPPAAVYGKDGKPLLSWRVLLLPYLDQNALYKEFHLDEPWDSAHNKKLLARMPKVFAVPTDEKALAAHETHYQGFVGKGTIFEGKKGILISDIIDGTSNTIMFVEAARAVPWTKPEDLPFDPSKPLPKLGGLFPKGFSATFCDGSVRFILNTTKPETLKLLIMRNDGQVIPADF
jgi:hypothetical protein